MISLIGTSQRLLELLHRLLSHVREDVMEDLTGEGLVLDEVLGIDHIVFL